MRSILAAFLLFALLSGCGRAPPRGIVEGVVLFQGQPLPGGVLSLRTQTPRGPETATIDIAADGRFRAVDLPPGKADISLTTETLKPPPGSKIAPESGVRRYVAIPARYHSFKTSHLSLDIGAGLTTTTIELSHP